MAAVIKDVDNGYRGLLKALEGVSALEITVGIHAEEGGAAHPNGRSVAEVAEANEFGLGVPARPAITAWADEKAPSAGGILRDALAEGLKAGRSAPVALDRVAQAWAGEVQAKYAQGIPPPNAPATIAKKGSSTPRIDTGQERSSILGRVDEKGGGK